MDKKQPYYPLIYLTRLCLAAGILLLLSSTATAALDRVDNVEPELLAPEQAFAFSATVQDGSTLQVSWKIADGYYMYRDRLRFSSETPGIELGEPSLPAGKIKDDEFFGKIATFRNQVTATIPVTRTANAPPMIKLKAVSQGCADIGVCYPPQTQIAQLVLPAPAVTSGNNQTLQALNAFSDNLGLGANDDEFLDPDIAFQADIIEASPTLLVVRWLIAEGYYLYRDKLSIQISDGEGVTAGPIETPAGEVKHDEFFGDVEVFHNEVQARVPLVRTSGNAADISIQLGYQGCAEAGICYPPIKKQIPVTLAAYDPDNLPAATTRPAGTTSDKADMSLNSTSQDDFARVLKESSLWWAIVFFFGAGVLLAFTACMYPMIPILSSIIVGQGQTVTTGKAFLLSLFYVEGMAVTYAIIGVVSAQLGAGVQAFFQNPWILTGFALVFVALALSMFGFFNLQLPASMQAKLSASSNRMKGGTLLGVFVMGILSALIVGPCAGPVLIGALLYTSQSGDYLTGALAMFALGNGMGAPLLVIGASGGKLLPRAGGWMDTVKAVFGVILLGVAIVMLERILPGPVTLIMWALLLIIPAIYMRALDALPEGISGWYRLWKGLGIAMLVYGIILIVGATTGARDPLHPLRNINTAVTVGGSGKHTSQHLEFERIKSIEDFNAAVQKSAAAGKPVMLDFYADWCTYCIKMEEYTFPDPRVQQELANATLLQADVTDNDETDIALLNHFKLFAPPAILFFGTDGQERQEHRLVGFLKADEFLEHVQKAIPE
ncbi:MAG: protein-disulfide reductase DsbD [Gammaproteobacteria bacterium]|nr:protein-disulfide reductase DsbD [Gammaproteobacteria bacterium]